LRKTKRKRFAVGQIGRFLLYCGIWSLLCLGAYWLYSRMMHERVIVLLYQYLPMEAYNWLSGIWRNLAVVCYLAGIFLIAMRRILFCARYAEQINRDLGLLMHSEKEISEYPESLKSTEVQLKDIQHAIFRSGQIAKEAEQRKNDLVVYLAHDLKTPLTSIIGYLSLLEEAPEQERKLQEKYVGIALNKAYRLEQLIDEFFEITRFNLQSIELSWSDVDLTMMLYQITEEFYPAFQGKGLRLETHIEAGLRIQGDADKLARIFDNLLRNAVSYSHENTTIELSAVHSEQWVQISVRNQGDRIPTQKLERLFEKFYRVDTSRGSASGGAGLGLAIAKQLVELHQGTIEAGSTEDYTEFTVRLPQQPKRETKAPLV
jgi:two-component system sensor histidine kinase VanS